jgi:DNA-binding transcriptional MocR family regulator
MGNAFHAEGKPIKAIRIAYAYCHLDYVADGIRHLCHAIRAAQN